MSSVTIRTVDSKSDRKRFIRFLWKIYDGNPAWVPPLLMDRQKLMDKKKNPFYKHADAEFYLAERNGEVVGRIAAILNHNHNKEHNENVGFFGFFESVNDQTVANTLFDTVKEYVKARGATSLRGPANPSVNDEYGLLVEGFDLSPTILMPYNPQYYVTLVEQYGFKKAKDLYSYSLSQEALNRDQLERVTSIVKQRHGITFRTLEMKRFDEEVRHVKEVYNKAWMKNWGAVPMTEDEINALAADLKRIVVPELVIFAEAKGKTIGFGITLPDINAALKHNKRGYLLPGLYHLMTKRKKINLARVIVLGVLPEYVNSGAAGVLFYLTAVNAQKQGIDYGEAGWVLEDNVPMNRAAEAMNGKIVKRYRIYETPI